MKNEERLMLAIVELSQADNFQEARREWFLKTIYKAEGTCLCGKHPIFNICIIRNKLNNNEAIVGSSCVEKFIQINSQKLFFSYAMIEKDLTAFLAKELIEYLYEHEVINEWEKEFLLSTINKKYEWLSEKQKLKRVQINEKVIKYMTDNKEVKPQVHSSVKDVYDDGATEIDLY